MDMQSDIVITLVHGTYARGAAWCKPNSLLCQTLTSAFPKAVFHRFKWSGRNSASERLLATQRLEKHLTKQLIQSPTSRHYVIAHSHGGNIAWSALGAPALRRSIAGLICLSTPFLHVRDRDLYPLKLSRDIPAIAIGILAFIFLVGWIKIMLFDLNYVALWSCWGAPETWNCLSAVSSGFGPPDGRWFPYFLPLLYGMGKLMGAVFILALVGTFLWGIFRPFKDRIASFFNQLRQSMQLPTLPPGKVLLIRMVGDEASALLVTSQFISWAITKAFMLVVRPVMFFTHGDDFQLVKALKERWDSFDEYDLLLAGVLSFILLMLLLPFFFILIVIAIIPFGLQLALAHLFLEITTESLPPGIWTVHQFSEPSSTDADSTRSVGLSHSACYQDSRVLELIEAFIKKRAAR